MSKTKLISIMIAAFVLLFANSLSAGTIQLPQTGQTKCHDTAGSEIPCAGTGQDGEIRAGVTWPDPRFTDNGDGTITDNLTGLMWAKYLLTPTVETCTGGRKTWDEALDYVTCLNSINYLGHHDWSLPNINELESLLSVYELGSWFYEQQQEPVLVWSSTTSIAKTDCAYIIDLWGDVLINLYETYKSNPRDVWPVRSGQLGIVSLPQTGQKTSYGAGDDGDLQRGTSWTNPRFIDNGNGTITDNLTGLTWTKDGAMHRVRLYAILEDSRRGRRRWTM